MKTRIDFQCRFYWPVEYDNWSGVWAWRREQTSLWLDLSIPSQHIPLPPQMFGDSANRNYWLQFEGQRMMMVDECNVPVIPFTSLSNSALWTQHVFHPKTYSSIARVEMCRPWWLRYRMPNAKHDLICNLKQGLDAIYEDTTDPDVRHRVGQLRREIILNAVRA